MEHDLDTPSPGSLRQAFPANRAPAPPSRLSGAVDAQHALNGSLAELAVLAENTAERLDGPGPESGLKPETALGRGGGLVGELLGAQAETMAIRDRLSEALQRLSRI